MTTFIADLYREDMIDDLCKLLSIPSVKNPEQADRNAPFGTAIRDALHCYMDLAGQMGMTTRIEDGYYGIAEFGPEHAPDSIGVFVHVDVVPASDGWRTPPFQPVLIDNKLYARGAVDNKGPAIAVLYAIRMLQDLQVQLSKKIKILVSTDEENGWGCMRKLRADQEPIPEIGFSPDLAFPVSYAEKGQINLDLIPVDNQSRGSDLSCNRLIHFQSGKQRNMIPDYAVAYVEINDQNESEVFQRKFGEYLDKHQMEGAFSQDSEPLRLEMFGKSAHASDPTQGVNAALSLLQFIKDHSWQPAAESFIRTAARIEELQFSDSYTACPTVFQFSDETSLFTVSVNIRFSPQLHELGVIRSFTAHLEGCDCKMSNLRIAPAHRVDPSHEIVTTLWQVFRDHTGQCPEPFISSGNTLASMMKYGVGFGPVFPGETPQAHQPNECMDVDTLLRCAEIYADALYRLARH